MIDIKKTMIQNLLVSLTTDIYIYIYIYIKKISVKSWINYEMSTALEPYVNQNY